MERNLSFRVVVNLLEFRDLARERGFRFTVKCLKKSARTKHFKGSSGFICETIAFENLGMSFEQYSEECIQVAVVGTGKFKLSIKEVYSAIGHQIKDQWCALTRKQSIAGLVKLSVGVFKQGETFSKSLFLEENNSILGVNNFQPYQLKLNVYKGQVQKIFMQMECNIYLTATLGDFTSRTKTSRNSFSPVWNEQLLIPFFKPSMAKEVSIKVYFSQRYSEDQLLDTTRINHLELKKVHTQPQWLNLYTGESKEIYAGRILVSACLVKTSEPLHSSQECTDANEPPSKNYLVWMELHELAGFQTKEDLKLEIQIGWCKFSTTYMQGSNYRWLWGKYAKLPEWMLELPEDPYQVPKVLLKVYCTKNSVDCLLGFIEYSAVSLLEHFPQKPEWRQFTKFMDPAQEDSKKQLIGSGLFRLNMSVIGKLRYFRPEMHQISYKPFEVRVLVYQAQNIQISDIGGLSDPYLTFSVNGVCKATQTIYESLNPQWNEMLAWRIDLPSNLKECTCLAMDLWNYNSFPKQDELLGHFECSLEALRVAEDFDRPDWVQLNSNSRIKPRVLVSFLNFPLKSRVHKIPQFNFPKHKLINCKLRVLIIGTRKINKFGLVSVKNPFVRVSAGNSVVDTKVGYHYGSEESSSHNFLEVLEVDLSVLEEPLYSPCAVIKVFEKGMVQNKFVGAVSVNLGNYYPWVSQTSEVQNYLFAQGAPKVLEQSFSKDCVDRVLNGNYTTNQSIINIGGESEESSSELKTLKWPGFSSKAFSRRQLDRSFEEEYNWGVPFETFALKRLLENGNLIEAGLINCSMKVVYKGGGELLEEIKRSYTENITVKLNILRVEKLSVLNAENCRYYLTVTSQNTQVESQVYESSEINSCFKHEAKLPNDCFLKINFWNKVVDSGEDQLIGSNEINIESRWHNKQYQSLKASGLSEIPIEKRTISTETGEEGYLYLWVELLDPEEAETTQQESLPDFSQKTFELRIVVWRLQEINHKKADLRVKGVILDKYGEPLEEVTDTHTDALESAEFNWRFKFQLQLPCPDPLLTLELLEPENPIGVLHIDLSDVYWEAQRLLSKQVLPKEWFPLFSVKNADLEVARVEIEGSLLLIEGAENSPVGRGRDPPNRDPPLHPPETGRSFKEVKQEIDQVNSKLASAKFKYKNYIALMCCMLIAVSVTLVLFVVLN